MANFSVGEDLFATLIAVCLISVFIVALAHSYHVYVERRAVHEHLDLALDTTEHLKNVILTKDENSISPCLIDPAVPPKLASYCRLLAARGTGTRIEVREFSGRLIWSYGDKPNPLHQYLSPPCSVSLPVAINKSISSRPLGELIVWVWVV